ncbi:MAG TPA: DUF2332 domain-containing protein [Rhizobacter sp.]|nr:DUF2332 domain-containing protein [Rhizobacter sp.]
MPLDPVQVAKSFRWFADHECADEPLYEAVTRLVAEQPGWLDLLADTPAEQQRPNLWLAAVHDLLLSGVAHPLSGYYASLGGTQAPDEALFACLAGFVAQHGAALHERMSSGSTQTNEIGRCAVLWPALQAIARRSGQPRLALLDLGCSAGLNLGVDDYRYDYGDGTEALAGVPVLPCRVIGPRRPPQAEVRIVQREGIDPAPVSVNDALAVRWLRACLWPSNVARIRRFDQAIALAQRSAWPVRREADCTAAVARWLDELPGDVQPVVVNSWVLTYFERPALQRHIETMTALVRERGLMWLSAEGPELRIGPVDAPPPFEEGAQARRGSLWTLCHRTEGEPRFELLARSHGHGRWMEWLDTAAG